MLKPAVPRQPADAAFDDAPLPEPRRWTRDEARALDLREPALSPWWVVAAQAVLGAACALVAWGVWGGPAAVSALYGAAVVVVSGALTARGATGPLATVSPMSGFATWATYAAVKTAAVFVMLAMASRVLPNIVWGALLATLAICLQTYWLALAVRPRARAGGR